MLAALLLGLLATGSTLALSTASTTVSPTSTPTMTTLATGISSTTATTTLVTTTTTHSPASESILSNPLALNEPSHGCGFAMSLAIGAGSATSNPSTTSTSTPPISAPDDAVPIRTIGHCTVLEIGDSLGSDLGWGLARELATTHALRLVQEDKSSSGLVTAWFYNWPQHLATLLRQYHPDLVIVCIGGNDEQNIAVNRHVYDLGSAQWRTVYSATIRQLDLMITRADSYVLWVGLPVMAPIAYAEGVATLNSLFRSVAATVLGVTYLPSWSLFSNDQDEFENSAPVNHITSVLRSPDGIHFSVVGENVFATFVANEIAAVYHVHLRPSQPAYITS